MIDLPDYASIIDALGQPLDPELRTLIAGRLKEAIANDLVDLTHLLVVKPGDSETDIIEAIGFSPLQSRIDGIRGRSDYDWIGYHPGWTELIYTVGDSGFAFIVFVQEADGVLPDLRALCRSG